MNAIELREMVLDRLPMLRDEGECPIPNARFWNFYRDNKEALTEACIGVRKDKSGEWVVAAYPFESAAEKEERDLFEIEKMRANHESLCGTCGKFPTHIEKKVMSNGVTQYQFYCCGASRSALPHKLVKHLVRNDNYEVIPYTPRPYNYSYYRR